MSAGRIRSVKPEWLEDELLAFASLAARVASIGLLLLADDYGNGRANVAWLRGQLFPGDESLDGTRSALAELVKIRFVTLYEVEGQSYFSIRNWEKHQRVDRPGKPRVPGPGEAFAKVPETTNPPCENIRGTVANFRGTLATDLDQDLDQDLEVDREQDPPATPKAPTATENPKSEPHGDATGHDRPEKAPRRRPQRALPSEWVPLARHKENASQRGIDILASAEKFRAHAESVDRRCADWDRAFDNWLLNERPVRGLVKPFDAFERAQQLREAGR